MNRRLAGRIHRVCKAAAIALATLVIASKSVAVEVASRDQPLAPKIKVGSGVDAYITGNNVEAFLIVEFIDERWRILNISEKPPSRIDPATQESLVFMNNLSAVEPYFREYYNYRDKKTKDKKSLAVNPYVCFSGERDERPKYNPCDSKLTAQANIAKTLFGNAVMTVFSLGTANMTLGVGSGVAIDNEKVLNIIKETDALTAVGAFVRQTRYRNAFERAKTVASNRAFIEQYKGNDPDGLVPRAEARIAEIEVVVQAEKLQAYRTQFEAAKSSGDFRVFIQRYETDDPDQLVPKAKQALKNAELMEQRESHERAQQARKLAAEDAERTRRAAAILASWRNALKIGDDTFCGPVIEIRQPMIKIAVRIQLPGYGTEAWLKMNEVFPAEAGCRNVNGRLSPEYR